MQIWCDLCSVPIKIFLTMLFFKCQYCDNIDDLNYECGKIHSYTLITIYYWFIKLISKQWWHQPWYNKSILTLDQSKTERRRRRTFFLVVICFNFLFPVPLSSPSLLVHSWTSVSPPSLGATPNRSFFWMHLLVGLLLESGGGGAREFSTPICCLLY